jgi:hypothetical protein
MGWPLAGFEPVVDGERKVDVFAWLDIKVRVPEDA